MVAILFFSVQPLCLCASVVILRLKPYHSALRPHRFLSRSAIKQSRPLTDFHFADVLMALHTHQRHVHVRQRRGVEIALFRLGGHLEREALEFLAVVFVARRLDQPPGRHLAQVVELLGVFLDQREIILGQAFEDFLRGGQLLLHNAGLPYLGVIAETAGGGQAEKQSSGQGEETSGMHGWLLWNEEVVDPQKASCGPMAKRTIWLENRIETARSALRVCRNRTLALTRSALEAMTRCIAGIARCVRLRIIN